MNIEQMLKKVQDKYPGTIYQLGKYIKLDGGVISVQELDEIERHKKYRVTVGNIGEVHTGDDTIEAERHYHEYCAISEAGTGKAAWEEVTLWEEGEPVNTYRPGTPEEARRELEGLGESVFNNAYGSSHEWLQKQIDDMQVNLDYLKRREA